jgi:pyruvate/2-oxoglutarate dehydrogenase complex dihydrolipoamide dehydrogenase (E3) component
MAAIEEYDLVVLGSGEAGKYLAWTLAAEGKRAAVIERRYVGGSCPNVACLPSKNLIHSAKVASHVRRAGEFGVRTAGEPVVDMAAVRARKREMVDGLIALHEHKFEASGAELVRGHGTFVAPRTVEVALATGGTRTLRGAAVVVSTGSRARVDDTPGLRAARPLTHVEALELDRVPDHLIVLGAGYIGLELAQAFRRFGSRVTILERNPDPISKEDPDVTAAVAELLRDEGIDLVAGVAVERVEGESGTGVHVHTARAGSPLVVEGTHLLAAGGRTPNTDGIGLDRAGIAVDARGHVRVDDRLRTSAEGVWAVGDCAGSPYFTHIAFDDFRVVRDTMAGRDRSTAGRQVPYCLFTDPELARVGLSEREAQDRKIPYRLAKIPMDRVLRSRTVSETRGFMKALIGPDDRVLGFTMFGPEAGEVLPVVQMAIIAGLPYTAVRDAVLTHPTMAEGLNVLFAAVPPGP